MKCDLCGEYAPGTVTREWFFGRELESHAVGAPYPTLGGLQQVVSKTYGDFHHSTATLCLKCLAQRRRRQVGEGILLLLGGLVCAAITIAMLQDDSVGALAKFLTGAFAVLMLLAAVAFFRSGEEEILQPIAQAKLGEGAWVCWTPDAFEALRSRSGLQHTDPPAALAGREDSSPLRTGSITAPKDRKCVSCGRPVLGEAQYCVWCERSREE